jgi:hypothetical protein
MPISFGDVLELMDALSDLHQQTHARLTRLVSLRELVIHGILSRLRVASDFERDGVPRGSPEIVADQFHGVRGEATIAKFGAPPLYRRSQQSGDGDVFAYSSGHTGKGKKQPSFLLLAGMLGKPFIQALKRAFAE